MNWYLKGLPLGLAGLALCAPGAHAATQVVANPAAGVSSVSLSDETEAGKVIVRATTPIADGHFSAMFFDIDADGDSDRAIVATKGSHGGSINVRVTLDSTSACQQFGGTRAIAITEATTAFAADNSGWTVKIPKSYLSGDFRWKITATAPSGSDLCGGTDDTVHGLASTLADARGFTAGTVSPPADTTPPAAPAGLTASAGDAGAAVDWADNPESDLAGYLVYRQAGAGTFTLRAEPKVSKLDDTGLANDVSYTYYVKAVDTAGNVSAMSAKVTVTPKAPKAPVVVVPDPEPQPQPKPPAQPPVKPPPAGTKMADAVGNLQLLTSDKPAEKPTFDARTSKVVVGVLYNADPVASVITAFYTTEVPILRRKSGSARTRTRTVVVGASKTTLQPGQAVALTFKLNAAGRKLARSGKALKITAKVTVRPKALPARKGTLKVTAKKAKRKAAKPSTKRS